MLYGPKVVYHALTIARTVIWSGPGELWRYSENSGGPVAGPTGLWRALAALRRQLDSATGSSGGTSDNSGGAPEGSGGPGRTPGVPLFCPRELRRYLG